jgi:tetratricopeptide (TPR) repeat protein
MSLDNEYQSYTIPRLFERAVSCHQQGDLEQAEKLYKHILQNNPEHPNALNMLGVLASQTHRNDFAESLLRKAIIVKSDSPLYYNNLALVLEQLGKKDEASKCFIKALDLNKDYCEANYNYGNLLLKIGQDERAVEYYRMALLQRPKYADAYNNLGQALYRIRKYEQAEDAYKQALQCQPDAADTYSHLGLLYQGLGRFADAISMYEEAIRVSPDSAAAYASLALSRKCISSEDNLIVNINSLLEQKRCNTEDTIKLLFALGKLYDDCGEYDLAFSSFKKANSLKSQFINFNPLGFQQVIDSIIKVFTKEFIKTHQEYGNPSTRPVFVVGMPRSGTSLVEQIVASHPAAAGVGELDYFNEQMGILKNQHMQHIAYWADADQQLFAEKAGRYLELLAGYVSDDRQKVVDKMPYNFLHLGLINIFFPQAKIINCRRDHMDTCLSIYCNDFEGMHEYKYRLSDIGFYYCQYLRLMDYWRETLTVPIMDVIYENLVANHEQVSRDIISFIGLPWDDKCLEFYKTERVVNTRSNVQVRQPIYNSSVKRWKHYGKHLGLLIRSLGNQVNLQ